MIIWRREVKLERSRNLSKVKRLVIKIGSSLLSGEKAKGIRSSFLRKLACQIEKSKKDGIECLVVTSGAIAAGLAELNLKKRPRKIPLLQALAAIGQSNLMHNYKVSFEKSGLKVAQILLTREDFSGRQRYINAKNTLNELFSCSFVPIVNENDTVAVEEIKFGDNDTLAVLVAHLVEADLLVLLTDMDGFFHEDPRLNPRAKLISDVFKLDSALEKSATSSRSPVGTGGMITKIQAARSMMQSGIPMVIANGNQTDVLGKILSSQPIGTFFHPVLPRMKSLKRWLTWSVNPKGVIIVDEGARKALVQKNTSLLPSGVKALSGSWAVGEIVKISDDRHQEIAKGISNYSSQELEKIKGLKTYDIERKLGYKKEDEVVHRDNIVKVL